MTTHSTSYLGQTQICIHVALHENIYLKKPDEVESYEVDLGLRVPVRLKIIKLVNSIYFNTVRNRPRSLVTLKGVASVESTTPAISALSRAGSHRIR